MLFVFLLPLTLVDKDYQNKLFNVLASAGRKFSAAVILLRGSRWMSSAAVGRSTTECDYCLSEINSVF